jgi:hypothetical protein
MRIEVPPSFVRSAKKLLKKFPSLQNELNTLFASLLEKPQQGFSLGNGCYKIRLSVASKGKGKSGGFRVITYVVIDDEVIFPLSIYDKNGKDSISDKELTKLIAELANIKND